ncbi:MAG TPA: NAD(P)-binding domain-containing protein, partial [Aggregatilineales bacterium]|nr:NAD(P)-binding domain-containing protein [Aggregatilineales bacterium]
MTPKVLVIGAGPAGIACAYYLQKANIPYLVVDKAPIIASTWASLYPSLKLNTTRFFSHLPERKFPLHYGIFPTGKQYHAYLVNYVHDFGFNIQLGVTVHSVCKEGDGWRVISNTGSA